VGLNHQVGAYLLQALQRVSEELQLAIYKAEAQRSSSDVHR
jgi:hypothetical protein